jgi:hypothetical protein
MNSKDKKRYNYKDSKSRDHFFIKKNELESISYSKHIPYSKTREIKGH